MNNIEHYRTFFEEKEKSKLYNSLVSVHKLEKISDEIHDRYLNELLDAITLSLSRNIASKDNPYHDMNKLLTPRELKIFRKKLEDLIKKLKLQKNRTLTSKIDRLHSKARISHLDELDIEIDIIINEMQGELLSGTTELLVDTVEKNYEKTVYNFHKFVGFAIGFKVLGEPVIEKMLKHPWSGLNYSDRITKNINNLKSSVKEEVIKTLAQRKEVGEINKTLSKRFKGHSKAFKKLINTEQAYMLVKVSEMAYSELGMDSYEYIATLDNRTCNSCRGLDGRVFKFKDAQVGLNFPPIHPMDRCSIAPVIDTSSINTKKYDRVNKNMSFSEWKDKYYK